MFKSIQILILVAGLFTVQQEPVAAQSQSVPAPEPEVSVRSTLSTPKPKPAFEIATDLGGLFRQLRRTRNSKLADQISTRIWGLWQTSNSKSVDLLTNWARGGKWDAGSLTWPLDLLDQVVVLRPDYAEGFKSTGDIAFYDAEFW